VGRAESYGTVALLHALIHRSAWKRNSANFAITEFSEVGSEIRLVASCLWWRGRSYCSCIERRDTGWSVTLYERG
jgi:hypothetical protein